MAETSVPADIKVLSFEEALAELETIVRQLEEGKGRLEEAIQSYARGAALKNHCEAKLREAREKVERIRLDASGGIASEPANIE